ncbi:class I SAM-dependent methyltransferase [Thalassovita sp.]|uniref:O-methyltransferase n=1 Tax=Thalassovita sp. TaxID=1979401 RepID=UPI002B273E50|nr:class I SAM-dependent methyltransferase [Thalassovita sp.]
MSKFNFITQTFADIPYMDQAHAALLRQIIQDHGAQDILEIGFFQGKSSAYIGAILEDQGAGHLVTIDRTSAANRSPNINDLLKTAGLDHRVTPRIAHRSYTWELQKLINSTPRPQFDLCYFDGGHHWDGTGFGVLLVDMLLKPGGILVLDDMNWSMATSPHHQKNPATTKAFSQDEQETRTVRLVWDTVLPHLGYTHVREHPGADWGVARKPG